MRGALPEVTTERVKPPSALSERTAETTSKEPIPSSPSLMDCMSGTGPITFAPATFSLSAASTFLTTGSGSVNSTRAWKRPPFVPPAWSSYLRHRNSKVESPFIASRGNWGR